jgi:hypothetical protein
MEEYRCGKMWKRRWKTMCPSLLNLKLTSTFFE